MQRCMRRNSYQGNYFERHTQFYRYAGSMTAIDAGLRFNGLNIGPVAFGLTFAAYPDIMNAKHPAKTTNDLLMLWNLEGGLYASYMIPVVRLRFKFAADTSFAISDHTSETYVFSTFGDVELDGKSRTGKWSGMRYSLSLSRSLMESHAARAVLRLPKHTDCLSAGRRAEQADELGKLPALLCKLPVWVLSSVPGAQNPRLACG